ncbi:CHAD domain-containing protein [Rothia sp. ARF10]|nr:CHAD domain-containing protein [Rothia sp. ARF10]
MTTTPGAAAVLLSPDLTATQALDVVMRAAGEHVRRHTEVLVAEREPEALHQVRVGVRRARSALSLLSPALGDGDKLAWVSAEIRDLAVPLGLARDLDITVRDHVDTLDGPAREQLLARRETAYDEVVALVGSERWSDLRTHVDGLLRHLHDEVPADPRATEAAAAALDRSLSRVLRRGASLAEASPTERHAVRKEARRLRYGVQAFGSLYAVPPASAAQPGSPVHEFARRVADVQDTLGDLGDVQTSRHLLELVGVPPPDADTDALLRRAESAVARLHDASPPWRSPVA